MATGFLDVIHLKCVFGKDTIFKVELLNGDRDFQSGHLREKVYNTSLNCLVRKIRIIL